MTADLVPLEAKRGDPGADGAPERVRQASEKVNHVLQEVAAIKSSRSQSTSHSMEQPLEFPVLPPDVEASNIGRDAGLSLTLLGGRP